MIRTNDPAFVAICNEAAQLRALLALLLERFENRGDETHAGAALLALEIASRISEALNGANYNGSLGEAA